MPRQKDNFLAEVSRTTGKLRIMRSVYLSFTIMNYVPDANFDCVESCFTSFFLNYCLSLTLLPKSPPLK